MKNHEKSDFNTKSLTSIPFGGPIGFYYLANMLDFQIHLQCRAFSSGWLAPESRTRGQVRVKTFIPGATTTSKHQPASSKIEYFKIGICKT